MVGAVAQLVEHWSEEPSVRSSNLLSTTKFACIVNLVWLLIGFKHTTYVVTLFSYCEIISRGI